MTTQYIKKVCYFFYTILFTITLLSTGCSVKSKSPGKVRLKLLMWGDPYELEAVKKNLSRFEAQYPKIQVAIYHAQGGLPYNQKLQTLAAAESLPDVMYVDSWDFPTYAGKNLFYPLTRFIAPLEPVYLTRFFPELLPIFKYKNEFYGIPKDFTPIVIYYNEDLFSKAGLDFPESNWDWNQFLQTAEKLTLDQNQDGFIDQYGVELPIDLMRLAPWLWQNNGGFQNKSGDFTFGTAPHRRANMETMQFLHDLIHKYKVAPMPQQTKDQNLFQTGRVAMTVGGRWLCLPFKKITRFKWNVTLLPSKRKKASTLVTVCYAMARTTKQPKAAWKLIDFLTSPTAQESVAGTGHAVPSLKEVAFSNAFIEAEELPKTIRNQVFLNAIADSRPLPLRPNWRRIESVFQRELTRFFNDPGANAAVLLSNIQKEVEPLWMKESGQ